jgi:aminopeptidase S
MTSALGTSLIDTSKPHSPSHEARLCGYNTCADTLTQLITIPSGTTSVTLSYWEAMDTSELSTLCVDWLAVQIKTAAGTTITTPQQLCNTAGSMGYTQKSFDLSAVLAPYAGQQVKLSIMARSNASATTTFYLDDVSLTASGGVIAPTSTPAPTNTSTPAPTATNTPVASPTVTTTPQSTPTSSATSSIGGSQLVGNSDFESGTTPWSMTSATGTSLVGTSKPHSPTHNAKLCGYNTCSDTMTQRVTIPAGSKTMTLAYWEAMDTSELSTLCVDWLAVQIKTATGTTITTPQQLCNTAGTMAYTQKSFDLSSVLAPYAGQQVTISILARSNASSVTTFYLDDVTLTASP